MTKVAFSSPSAPRIPGGIPSEEGQPLLSAAQVRFSSLESSFCAQSADLRSLGSMTLAGLLGRLAPLALPALPGGLLGASLQALLRQTLSLSTEAAALEALQRWRGLGSNQSFARSWACSLIDFSAFRAVNAWAGKAGLPQHLLQSLALFAGRRAVQASGLGEETPQGLAEQIFSAQFSALQLRCASALGSWASGGTIARLERGLELSRPQAMPSLGAPERRLPRFASRLPEDLPRAGLEALEKYRRFEPLLEPREAGVESYAKEILAETLGIEGKDAEFHEALLQAYATSPQRGTLDQYKIARAIALTYELRQAGSSTGSFKGALLEECIDAALAQPQALDRNLSMHRLFGLLEQGCPPHAFGQFFRDLADGAHSVERLPPLEAAFQPGRTSVAAGSIALFRAGYSPEHQRLLLRWVRSLVPGNPRAAAQVLQVLRQARETDYPPELVDQVVELARTHPFGLLILRRFLHVAAAQDLAAKLEEIPAMLQWRYGDREAEHLVRAMHQSGMPAEQIAEQINRTRHTAYLNDLRFARKMVSVCLEVPADPKQAPLRRIVNQYRAHKHLSGDLAHRLLRRPFCASDLFHFLRATEAGPQAEQMERQWREGLFRIEVVPAAEFRMRVRLASCDLSYFWMKPEDGGAPLILLRQMEGLNPQDPLYTSRLLRECIHRARACLHEWEHWRHISGNYEGMERGGEPFLRNAVDRPSRYASEGMAYFEEERWGLFHDADNLSRDMARLMGINLATYYRHLADMTYYAETNERLARQLLR